MGIAPAPQHPKRRYEYFKGHPYLENSKSEITRIEMRYRKKPQEWLKLIPRIKKLSLWRKIIEFIKKIFN